MGGARRSWYHVSRRSEAEWVADRRPPLIRAPSEPATPRVCVAPTVAQALAAVWHLRPASVYVTEPRRTLPPSGVFDQALTGERWVVPPVRLHLLGVIPLEALRWAQGGLEPVDGQDYRAGWVRRAERMRRMVEVVEAYLPAAHEAWVGVFAERVRAHFAQGEAA